MNSIDRENVLDGITDLNSVYLLRDEDIKNRINFLLDHRQSLDPDWFTQGVVEVYLLLINVANKKQLFKSVKRSTDVFDRFAIEILADPDLANQRVNLIQ
jgi:hypothetical protein